MATQRRKFKADPIRSVKIAVNPADFTDGGAASGTYDAANQQIPAGSIVLGCKINAPVGWTGDTTAVAIAGTSGDDDAFSETAVSVLAAAAVGYGHPATYNTDDFLTAATTIRITVTGASDFTIFVTAGLARLEVEVYYIDLNAKSK